LKKNNNLKNEDKQNKYQLKEWESNLKDKKILRGEIKNIYIISWIIEGLKNNTGWNWKTMIGKPEKIDKKR
jgi:hypothetical protein